MGNTKQLSQQLRDAIDASDMTRYRICKTIGLPQSTMSHFMAGQCGLSIETIDKLAALLGLRLVTRQKAPKAKGR